MFLYKMCLSYWVQGFMDISKVETQGVYEENCHVQTNVNKESLEQFNLGEKVPSRLAFLAYASLRNLKAFTSKDRESSLLKLGPIRCSSLLK